MRANSHRQARQRGSALVLFTLMLPAVLIPLVGLAIDATMCHIVQAKLSAAVDGAALGAGRLLGTNADAREIAGEFLTANFRAGASGFWNSSNLTSNVVVTLGTTKTIAVNATANVPLLFARIFGQNSAVVSAAATATRRDSRMVLVVDRSGSMNTVQSDGNTAIADVVSFAQGFAESFTNGVDELGLVVFDGSAVVGYPTTRPWVSTTTSSSTGGPDTSFYANSGNSCCDMVWQIKAIDAGNGTNTSEALWMAYIELQKAHMKDLAANGIDDRLNSIVLFTDGVPAAVSVDLNNPNWNALKSTSPCTYRTNWAAQKIRGWISVRGDPPWGQATLPDTTNWPRLLASTDPTSAHTANWWMSNAGMDWVAPNPTTPFSGCSGLVGASGSDSATALGDLTQIPSNDLWGNSMTGTAYHNSVFINTAGNVVSPSPVYDGTHELTMTSVTSAYNWGLAIWNSVASAAGNIRSDSNLANRAGDSQNMNIAIYTIGYTGNAGCDQGLLKMVANTKDSATYNSAQATGVYARATSPAEIAAAFNTIASAILRLSK